MATSSSVGTSSSTSVLQVAPSSSNWTSRTSHHVSLIIEDPTTKGQIPFTLFCFFFTFFYSYDYSYLSNRRVYQLSMQGDIFEEKS